MNRMKMKIPILILLLIIPLSFQQLQEDSSIGSHSNWSRWCVHCLELDLALNQGGMNPRTEVIDTCSGSTWNTGFLELCLKLSPTLKRQMFAYFVSDIMRKSLLSPRSLESNHRTYDQSDDKKLVEMKKTGMIDPMYGVSIG